MVSGLEVTILKTAGSAALKAISPAKQQLGEAVIVSRHGDQPAAPAEQGGSLRASAPRGVQPGRAAVRPGSVQRGQPVGKMQEDISTVGPLNKSLVTAQCPRTSTISLSPSALTGTGIGEL